MGRAKCQNAAGIDRNFLACFWIAADAGRFVADRERPEGRDFDLLALNQGVGHMFKNGLYQLRAFIPGQTYFAKDSFA